jgi:hypothetical protein
MIKNFEFEITYRCNTVCQYCNRLLGVIDLSDSDLTIAQTHRICDLLIAKGWTPEKIKLSGGEPRMNPQLSEIRDIIETRLNPRTIWTLSNDTPELTSLPYPQDEGHKWHTNPLPKQNHDPFLISPVDAGMTEHQDIPRCKIRRICGRAVDAYGFTFCPVAPMLGRLLRINPYSPEPYNEQDHRICKHCPDSLPEEQRKELYQIAIKGQYPSMTFREGLRQYKESPYTFPRLEADNHVGIQEIGTPPGAVHDAGVPAGDGADVRDGA